LAEEKQEKIAKRIGRRLASGHYETLLVNWFGAEPLIGLRVMRTLTSLLRETASDNNCKYRAQIVTNGLLLSLSVAEELVTKMGVTELVVTLDGPAKAHDARRHTKKGSPTFARIFSNVLSIARADELPVKLAVRCNVDHRNAAQVPELIELLAEAGIQQRVELYFAPVHDWSNGADSLSLSSEEYARREIDWLALMSLRGFTPPLLPALKPVVCMAVNPHAELIDPYGEIFNCTEVSLVPAYGEPNIYSLGTLDKPGESSAATELKQFMGDVEEKKYGCARCPMLPVCGGACPKQWNEGNVPCPSAKYNMPDRLALAYALQKAQR